MQNLSRDLLNKNLHLHKIDPQEILLHIIIWEAEDLCISLITVNFGGKLLPLICCTDSINNTIYLLC